MRILFLMLDLPSDANSSNLYLDLALEFLNNKHEVFVIAPAKSDQKTNLYIEKGINVLRVKTLKQIEVKSFIKKGLAQLLLPYQYKFAYSKFIKNIQFDLLLMPTPPISLVDFAIHVKKRTKAKFYLILRDIYPQAAADIGLIKYRFIFSFLRYIEKKTYKNADIIGCMSQGNVDYIHVFNPNIPSQKLQLLPNWQKEHVRNKNSTNIRKKHNLENKYLVLFGGNIGNAQRVENIVLLANKYRNNEQIVFLVIGNGVKKKYLQDIILKANLQNVIFIDGLPRDDYMNFVETSDIGLISINENFTVPTIPSKTTSYMCLKLPILAIIDTHTDYGKILDESGAGLWSVGGNDKLLFDNFDKLYTNALLRMKMGENGYKYFINNLTSERAYQNIMKSI